MNWNSRWEAKYATLSASSNRRRVRRSICKGILGLSNDGLGFEIIIERRYLQRKKRRNDIIVVLPKYLVINEGRPSRNKTQMRWDETGDRRFSFLKSMKPFHSFIHRFFSRITLPFLFTPLFSKRGPAGRGTGVRRLLSVSLSSIALTHSLSTSSIAECNWQFLSYIWSFESPPGPVSYVYKQQQTKQMNLGMFIDEFDLKPSVSYGTEARKHKTILTRGKRRQDWT